MNLLVCPFYSWADVCPTRTLWISNEFLLIRINYKSNCACAYACSSLRVHLHPFTYKNHWISFGTFSFSTNFFLLSVRSSVHPSIHSAVSCIEQPVTSLWCQSFLYWIILRFLNIKNEYGGMWIAKWNKNQNRWNKNEIEEAMIRLLFDAKEVWNKSNHHISLVYYLLMMIWKWRQAIKSVRNFQINSIISIYVSPFRSIIIRSSRAYSFQTATNHHI